MEIPLEEEKERGAGVEQLWMEVFLKGGARVRVAVDKFSTDRSSLTGDLTTLSWTASAHAMSKLHFIAPAEIAAVVATWEPTRCEAVNGLGRRCLLHSGHPGHPGMAELTGGAVTDAGHVFEAR